MKRIVWCLTLIGLSLIGSSRGLKSAPPPFAIASFGLDKSYYMENENITVTVSLTGGTGNYDRVEMYYAGTGSSATVTTGPTYSHTFSGTSNAPGAGLCVYAFDSDSTSVSDCKFVNVWGAVPYVYLSSSSSVYMADQFSLTANFDMNFYAYGGIGGVKSLKLYNNGVLVSPCGDLTLPNTSGYICSFTLAVGTYNFRAEAADHNGNTSTSNFTVLVDTPYPKVTSFYADSVAYNSPATIILTAHTNHGVGGINHIDIFNIESGQKLVTSSTGIVNINQDTGGSAACLSTGPNHFVCTLTKVPMGKWTFSATAFDNSTTPNASATIAPVKVTVTCQQAYADDPLTGFTKDCQCYNTKTTHFTRYSDCRTCADTCREVATNYSFHEDCIPWPGGDASAIETRSCVDEKVVGGITVTSGTPPTVKLKPPWDASFFKSTAPGVSPSPAPS